MKIHEKSMILADFGLEGTPRSYFIFLEKLARLHADFRVFRVFAKIKHAYLRGFLYLDLAKVCIFSGNPPKPSPYSKGSRKETGWETILAESELPGAPVSLFKGPQFLY